MAKNCVYFLFFLFILNQVKGQTNFCVDYDERYPRTSSPGVTHNWHGNLWNFTNLKQKKKLNVNFGNTYFKGLLEYTPDGYDPADTETLYPVIIYFHGYASRGEGTDTHLCRLFKDRGGDSLTHLSIPGRIENSPGLFTQTINGKTYKYIVISPQFNAYQRVNFPVNGAPDAFPSFNEVDDVIDYVEANYRVDPRAIFLTGLSNGANIVAEYAASSLARAQRVAGVMPVALCSQLNHESNTNRGINPAYIGQAKLKTWFVYCASDNCGSGPALSVSDAWVNAIKAVPGSVAPRFTILKNQDPATLYNCSDTLWHDAWSRAYNPDFRASFVNGTGANDGINMNMYEWFSSITNAVLPVTLKSFAVRLINNKVEVNWITTDEKNNSHFTIERAGDDQKFVSIGTVPGAGDNTGEKAYSFTDNNPLTGLNYYRLVQTDIDGKKSYFEIKRILNSSNKNSSVIVSPNPFGENLSAFISLDKSQKLFITVSDMTGKILKTANGIYGQGSSELKIQSGELPKGIYLLKVSGENFNSTQKVIKK